MADGDHDATVIIANGAPLGNSAVDGVGAASPDEPCAGDLEAFVEIVHDVKNLVIVSQVFDGTVRKNQEHAPHEIFPLVIAVGIVNHHEATL